VGRAAQGRRLPSILGILLKREIASGALINVSGPHRRAQRVTVAR
jgi:hypothetical protein